MLTLTGLDMLPECPGCTGREFVRASLFNTERIDPSGASANRTTASRLSERHAADRDAQLASVRDGLERPGEYLCYEEDEELRTISLAREWIRIGRSLTADVRFDDPTVSRRHALIVRQGDDVRVLDDRSLNGVFVNGTRVEAAVLEDGDEIVVGRYRISFLRVSAGAQLAAEGRSQSSLPTAG